MSRNPRENAHPEWLLSAEDDHWQRETFHSFGWRFMRQTNAWHPPTDVLETDDAIVVIVEIAGMRGAEFSVTFDQQVLTIRGHRTETNPRRAYHQIEIDYGEFMSIVKILAPVDSSGIEAAYSDGFLRVNLPKALPRQVSIDE